MFNSEQQSKIVFETSDYDLDLNGRKAKFKDYDLIFCGECQRQFDRCLFYCKYCYFRYHLDNKEKNRMLHGRCKGCFQSCTKRNWCSSCGFQNNGNIEKQTVFKTTDYDLNQDERKIKFKDYDLIFCGKCKRKFGHDLFYCEYCYNNETNKNERSRMLNKKCKKCIQLCMEPNWCSSCGFQDNDNIEKQTVFKTTDYDLNRGEREVKYKDYDLIFCGKCKRKFGHDLFYCESCYNNETNKNERIRMLNKKCKQCTQLCTEPNWCSSCGLQNNENIKKQTVFKTTDYDLNLDERKVKFKDYDLIFCGECKKKFDHNLFCCDYCYNKKTNEEKNSMLYGKCKKCFQPCTEHNWCSSCGFQNNKNIGKQTVFKTTDYDLNRDERKVKFKNYDLIFCGKCKQIFVHNLFYCEYCYDCYDKEEKNRMLYGKCKKCLGELLHRCLPCRFKQDFDKWTSGNKNIDELIRESQISACDFFGIIEWIPYNRFTNIKFIAEGGFAKVYSAIWIDGYIKDWEELNNWKRCGSFKVALKVLNNSSENISEDFLNEVKSLKIFPNVYSGVITFYGITREPTTHNYALVFKLEDSGLRHYLVQNYNLLMWEGRLCIIQRICSGLRSIHNYGLIHKDFHIGNILHSILKNNQSFTYICDFGFCMPANEPSSKSNIYGVMPYMAPEILRRKPYTKASDIYSLGIIINEIISIIPPFNEEPHDHYLALDICRGRRPKIREETPEFLKELIKKCWDANPENRPSSDEIDASIRDSYKLGINAKKLKELSYDLIATTNSSSKTQLFKTHPDAIYTSRLLNLPNLPEPINCQNQEEFVSSRNTAQVQTGEVYILDSDECFDCKIAG